MRLKIFATIAFMLIALSLQASNQKKENFADDREYWVQAMIKIIDPVFTNLSNNTLRENMPVETLANPDLRNRKQVSHLEALGRSFSGISPWLNLGPDATAEGQLREKYIQLCIKSIKNAVDPESPDYMTFGGKDAQVLVDAAFFAHGLIRSKSQIWDKLDKVTQKRVIAELKASRKHIPGEQNWLLFSAMVETALLRLTGTCDMKPISYAVQRFNEWYKGDAWYGDGREFHLDYYNSFVIHPMLLETLKALNDKKLPGGEFYEAELARFVRYADQLEKMISPEGTYPVIGRSMSYRFGAFNVLGEAAWMQKLPQHIRPAQVRSALTAVIKRQLAADTFDANGWLQLGFCGHQPQIAETYISTGSLYLCTFVFIPLGLDAGNEFWTAPPAEWSSVKAWSGKPLHIDKALKDVK